MKSLVAFLAALLSAGAAAQEQASAYRVDGVERVVAVADIHGAYEDFAALLESAGLVDGELRWRGGADHLVIVGDVLDRGEGSRAALDLVIRLQEEAAAAGGAVHMVLGNHEVMNLTGELAYVSRQEFRAYDDLENSRVRRDAQSRFEASDAAIGLDRLRLRTAFSQIYPRGFFGHRAAFAPDGVYGAWLLRQPVLLVVNGIAFAHAGLSAAWLGQDLETVNRAARDSLSGYLGAMQTLIEEEVIHPETDFHRHRQLARAWVGRYGEDSATGRAAAALAALRGAPLFAADSPVWYRGMVDCSPALEAGRLREALAVLGATSLVVGHTPTRDHRVNARFGGALLLADTGMLESYYGGQPAALVFENGSVSVLYPEAGESAAPVPQPRLIGPRPLALDDTALETLLAGAQANGVDEGRDGRLRVQLRAGGERFEAVFSPAPQDNQTFIPEVAAYRLDRLLGMDLLPVAALGEAGGRRGAFYFEAEDWGSTEAPSSAWCPPGDQRALAAVFDFLLNHPGRQAGEMRFGAESGKLALRHSAEILAPGVPAAGVQEAAAGLTPALREELQALDAAALQAALGEVLDAERRQALLERRDALLSAGGG